MKRLTAILILICSITALSASPKLTFQYDSRFVMFPRGDKDIQSTITHEEIQGEIYKERDGVYSLAFRNQEMMMRLYNGASIDLKLGGFSVYSQFRHIYGLHEDDMYTPFAVNSLYAQWQKGSAIMLRAGRFYAADRTIRRSLDGAMLQVRYAMMSTAVLYGAEAPSPYSGDVAPDFYGWQFLSVNQCINLAKLGKTSLNYTMKIDGDGKEDPNHIAGLTWSGKFNGLRVKLNTQYLITDERFGDGYLIVSKPVNDKIYVSGEYRMIAMRDWLINPKEDISITGMAYDQLRVGAFYELNSKIGVEITEFLTLLPEESYSSTFLEAVFPYGAAGLVYINSEEESNLEFSARLHTTLWKKLKIEGGFNYLSDEFTGHYEGNEELTATGFGTYAGLNAKILKGLNAGARIYQMQSPNFDNHIRATFNLSYRVAL
jgi:outer membrane protein assembly factor BamB